MEHIKLFKCIIISELRCHENHFTSSKTAPLCFEAGLDCQNVYNPNIRQIN